MGMDDDSYNADSTDIILFMFFGLILGIIVLQLLSRFGDPVPYTVVIFALGVLFSIDNEFHGDGMWGNSIKKWSKIDAELMLFVFLPPLIFGEAMSLNWFFVIGGFVQSLILAGPGVLIGAAAMAGASKYIIPHNWSWYLSLVFGSILSATDPVAVVALLKGAGASPKLTILIVGESLLNDGTAMVLFTLFFNMLRGHEYTAGNIILFFFNACFGSPIFGVACGLFIVRWLRTCNRSLKEIDTVIQICITVCSAYLIFFIAQNPLQVSGVLACCGAGAMMAWLAPPIILNHESMHNVWSIIEWMGNTLIFLLAGLIIGTRTLRHVNYSDWWIMLVLYLVLMAIRAVVIFMLFPWLSTTGHKCTANEAVFMSWAGLRGALSMALALIVEKEGDATDSADQSSRLFFYVGGIASLTLLINATSAQALLLKLGLMGDNNIEQDIIITQIRKRLRKKVNKFVKDMHHNLNESEVEDLRQSCSLLRESDADDWIPGGGEHGNISSFIATMVESGGAADGERSPSRRSSRSRGASMSLSHSHADGRSRSADLRDKRWESRANSVAQLRTMSRARHDGSAIKEILAYVRTIFLEIVRVNYWHDIEAGKLPRLSHSAQFLLFSVDVALDSVRDTCGLQDWLCLERELDHKSIIIRGLTILEQFAPGTMISRIVGRLEARKEKRAVYLLTSFIDAHERAQQKMHSYVGIDEDEEVQPEEVQVKEESIALVQLAKQRLEQMPRDTVSAIQAKQAARMLLAKQAELVKEMVKEGLLTAKHAEEFLDEISEDTQKIEKERNRMYRAHAADSATKRAQMGDRDSFFGRISNVKANLVTISEDLGSTSRDPSVDGDGALSPLLMPSEKL